MADHVVERGAERSFAGRRALALPSLRALSLTGAQRTALALALAVAGVFAVQAPVLAHYFFNDDFVPLADIATRSTGGYVKDLFLLRDLTPNWRFLTGLFYLAEYRSFGLHAFPYLLVNVVLHTATAGLIFWLVRRVTRDDWPALLAAGFFGLAAATVPTVGQITALNNVLAGFLVMLAIVLLYEALDRDAHIALYAGSIAAFAAAIASNESASIVAPVFGLFVLWKALDAASWREPRTWLRVALFAAPFAVLGGAALIGFGTCRCTEAELYSRDDIVQNVWLYFGRLLYPVGLEFPGHVGTAHMVAGPAVAALVLLALVRGPALARIAAVFLVLAVLPYLPIQIWAASRYTYLASVPFAILAAFFFAELGRLASRLSPALPALVAVLAIGAIGLNGWQTWVQNADQAGASDRWRQLVTAADDAYAGLPPKSTVYVRGGPITDELSQCTVMPAIGEVLWGDAKLFTFPKDGLTNYRARPGYHVYVGDFIDGRIAPQPVPIATDAELQSKDVFLLPHISPDATGNVCRLDVPRLP